MSKGFETVNLHGCASGTIPVPVIGENGNWYIGNDDTGIHAQGVKGETGVRGEKGETGAMGPQGPKGDKGEIDAINDQIPTYMVASDLTDLTSGEKVSTAFGKIAKAVGVLIGHVAARATESIIGHVKLSDSSSVMEKGAYALDAVEKNVEVPGTLASQIAEQKIYYPYDSNFQKFYKLYTETYTATDYCKCVVTTVTSGTAFEIIRTIVNDVIVRIYQNPVAQIDIQDTFTVFLKPGDIIKCDNIRFNFCIYKK